VIRIAITPSVKAISRSGRTGQLSRRDRTDVLLRWSEGPMSRPGGRKRVRSVPENPQRRTPELDQVRRLLFPSLPPDEGWARIEGALAAATDDARIDAIEDLAEGDLPADLIAALKRLQAQQP